MPADSAPGSTYSFRMERRSFRTSDGVELSYLEGGSGPPLILLPGWSQTAAMYGQSFAALTAVARVIALDHRGHGESAKPEHGYRIQCLSKDLFELIRALDLEAPDVVGHSMGATVIWSYLSLWGAERPLGRLVFIDEGAALLNRPQWSEEKRRAAGASVPDLAALAAYTDRIERATTPEAVADLIRRMFTPAFPQARLLEVAQENLKLPRRYAAVLMADNVIQDWTSVCATIRNPTLLIGGAASHHPIESMHWLAEAIPGAQLDIVPAAEGGSHFCFYENPRRFNERVVGWLRG